MNKSNQSISVAVQAKLLHALTPKPGNVGIQFEGPNEIGKTIAMRDYVKANRGTVVVIQSEPGNNRFE